MKEDRMDRYKLMGTDKIPVGAHVNLGVTEVVVGGIKVTRIIRGEVLIAESIEHPERIQSAADAGLITMEKVGAAPQAAKHPTGD